MSKSGKGSQWERDICKFLSKWINGSEKPYVFWRGRGSGAAYTLDNSVGEAFSGDVYAVREEGKFFTERFSIECKNGYPSASLDLHLKMNKNEDIKNFWQQTIDGCQADREPLLIFKKKGMPVPWVCISAKTYELLKDILKDLRFVHLNWVGDNLPDMYIFDLKRFFDAEHITPEIIQKRIQ